MNMKFTQMSRRIVYLLVLSAAQSWGQTMEAEVGSQGETEMVYCIYLFVCSPLCLFVCKVKVCNSRKMFGQRDCARFPCTAAKIHIQPLVAQAVWSRTCHAAEIASCVLASV